MQFVFFDKIMKIFSYGGNTKTSMDELIHIKNKIHIKPPKGEINPQDESKEND